MSTTLPAIQEIRSGLEVLCRSEMQALSEASGVPFTTLWKIRVGETKNPGIETVRSFYGHMTRVRAATAHQSQSASDQATNAPPGTTSSTEQGVAHA